MSKEEEEAEERGLRGRREGGREGEGSYVSEMIRNPQIGSHVFSHGDVGQTGLIPDGVDFNGYAS
ncbi:hypothetical protein EYF80_047473 [Liparis tanakae]|uniref:Uncharacterized protein n=1 Tax=Liparis tanakae TaxID=230148 RepID=A0A4Z2FM86_9TELE|nr:hypothetical protein EYF80_047473 [Liparis tanakae]